jgi:hypothetical protein
MRMRHATTSKDTHVYVACACTMQKQAKAGNSGRRWQPPRAADLGAEVGAVDLGVESVPRRIHVCLFNATSMHIRC